MQEFFCELQRSAVFYIAVQMKTPTVPLQNVGEITENPLDSNNFVKFSLFWNSKIDFERYSYEPESFLKTLSNFGKIDLM